MEVDQGQEDGKGIKSLSKLSWEIVHLSDIQNDSCAVFFWGGTLENMKWIGG